jgi:hypothetical protein
MAKRGRKSAAIKAVLAEKPGASVKEIQSALAAKRVKASVALISKLKSGRKSAANGIADGVTFDQLLAAKALVARVGSVDVARKSIDALAKLVG